MKESAPLDRPASFPLRRRLGLFALGVLGILAMVCGVAVHQLAALPTDAMRAMLIVVGLATLGFAALLLWVLRTVVRPLHALEEMAAARPDALEEPVSKARELVRAARYADLGVLAASVAREINNPLANIAACAEGMQRRLEHGPLERTEDTEYSRTIASEAYRARDITQRLLALARPHPLPVSRVVLRTLLQELQRVTRLQLERRNVRLEIEAPEGLAVHGNSAELLQALANLVLNARDASPAGKSVRLTASRHGSSAVIDIDDEGPGVSSELVERIFEPFFSTKALGEGTGLGLSLVAAIVESHGGSIAITRSPADGARFRLRIPLDNSSARALPATR